MFSLQTIIQIDILKWNCWWGSIQCHLWHYFLSIFQCSEWLQREEKSLKVSLSLNKLGNSISFTNLGEKLMKNWFKPTC